MNIPLPKGINGLAEFPKLREYYINMMWTENGPMRTPGIKSFSQGSGAIRGASNWFGKRYQVAGSSFERVNEDKTLTNLGSVSGSQEVVFSEGQVNLVFIVKGGKGYRYNETDGLVEITDSDFYSSVDVDFIDGRHVFIPADGEPAFYSEVDQGGNIEPLSFFDAEELPDKNKCVINISNQLFIGGSDSFEQFRTQVDPDAAFTRREGARVDVGYVSAKVRFKTTFAFLGRRRGEAYRFYAMTSGDAVGISNEAIDELLNEHYTLAQLESCRGERFEYKGHEVLVFSLQNHTLIFSNGQWSYLDSTIDGKVSPWRGKGITHTYGKYLVGDVSTNDIGELGNYSQEYGQDIELELQTFVRSERNSFFSISKIEIDCLMGQTLDEKTIGLSVSRDGWLWSDFHYRGLGTTGQYSKIVRWHPAGGIGQFENFCGLRIRSTADINFPIEALSFK